MIEQIAAPLYLTRFKCLGSDCPDDCCTGWRIPFERDVCERIERSASANVADANRVRNGFVVNPDGRPVGEQPAFTRLTEDRKCHFLEPDGLCYIHKALGEDHLSYACAMYPRSLGLVGGRLEAMAVLSCPETARLCLLEDDALQMFDVDDSILPPIQFVPERIHPSPEQATSYERPLDFVRLTMIELLSNTRYPLDARLFFSAFLAHRVTPFFHRGSTGDCDTQFRREVDLLLQPGSLRTLEQTLQQAQTPVRLVTTVLRALLTALLEDRDNVAFAGFARKILEHYGFPVEETPGNEHWTVSLGDEQLQQAYGSFCSSRRFWRGHFAPRIDRYFRNYCVNYWMREWYTASESLMVHVQRLLIRIIVLRFLLFGHPSLTNAEGPGGEVALETQGTGRAGDFGNSGVVEAESGVDPDHSISLQDRLDETAVAVFWLFARSIEHNARLLSRIEDVLVNARTLPFLASFVLF